MEILRKGILCILNLKILARRFKFTKIIEVSEERNKNNCTIQNSNSSKFQDCEIPSRENRQYYTYFRIFSHIFSLLTTSNTCNSLHSCN